MTKLKMSSPESGKYVIVTVPSSRVQLEGGKPHPARTIDVIIPASLVGIDVDHLMAVKQKWNYGLQQTPLLELMFADLMERHPGAVMGTHYNSTMSKLPVRLGIPEDATVACSKYYGLDIALGSSSYRIRKASDQADLHRRIGAAVKSLEATERKRLAKRPTVKLDPLARWMIGNLRPDAADRMREQLDAWAAEAANNPAGVRQSMSADLDAAAIVGCPAEAKLTISSQNVVSASIAPSGEIKLTGNSITLYHVADSIVAALPGRLATDIMRHPYLDGRRIASAVNNVAKAHKGQVMYAQVVLEHVAPVTYDPEMVKAVPYLPSEAEKLRDGLLEGREIDDVAAHAINAMTPEEAVRRLHRTLVQRRPDHAARKGMRLMQGKRRIEVEGRLAGNAKWIEGTIRITHLPETVITTLLGRGVGRPVREILDHPAFTGKRIRAVNDVRPTRPRPGQPTPAPYVVLHIEDDVEMAMAA